VPPNLVAPFGPPKFYRDRLVVFSFQKGIGSRSENGDQDRSVERRVAAAGSTNQLDRPAPSHRSLIQLIQPCAEAAAHRRRVWRHRQCCDLAGVHVAMVTTNGLTMHARNS